MDRTEATLERLIAEPDVIFEQRGLSAEKRTVWEAVVQLAEFRMGPGLRPDAKQLARDAATDPRAWARSFAARLKAAIAWQRHRLRIAPPSRVAP